MTPFVEVVHRRKDLGDFDSLLIPLPTSRFGTIYISSWLFITIDYIICVWLHQPPTIWNKLINYFYDAFQATRQATWCICMSATARCSAATRRWWRSPQHLTSPPRLGTAWRSAPSAWPGTWATPTRAPLSSCLTIRDSSISLRLTPGEKKLIFFICLIRHPENKADGRIIGICAQTRHL